MPVALIAVNDQRAVCFRSVMIAAASMGLSLPLLKAAAASRGVRWTHCSVVRNVALPAAGQRRRERHFW